MKIYFFLLHKINCWFPKSTKPLSEAETTTFKFNDLTYHCIAISHHLTSYQHLDSRYLDTSLLRLCRLGLTWRGMVTVAVCGPAETEGERGTKRTPDTRPEPPDTRITLNKSPSLHRGYSRYGISKLN